MLDRITTLEDIVKNINDEMKTLIEENKNKHSNDDRFPNLESKFEKFKKTLEVLVAELGSKFDDIERFKEQLEISKNYEILVSDTIDDIDYRRIEAAQEKLKSIDKFSDLQLIVKKMYANELQNFDFALEFCERAGDPRKRLLMLKAFKNEIEMRKHFHYGNIIKLIISLNLAVIDQKNAPADVKQEAMEIDKNLTDNLQQTAVSKVKNDFRGHKTDFSQESKDILNAIYLYEHSLFKNVIKEAVKNLPSYSILRSLDYIQDLSDTDQKILGLIATYEAMRLEDKLNDSNVISKMIFFVNNIISSENYRDVSADIQKDLEGLKTNLINTGSGKLPPGFRPRN